MIYVGTTNKGKLAEFEALLAPLGVTVKALSLDVPEPGVTFEENVRHKAHAYACEAAKVDPTALVLCEDSGLVVPALNGLPGPWSARFAALARLHDIDTAIHRHAADALEPVGPRPSVAEYSRETNRLYDARLLAAAAAKLTEDERDRRTVDRENVAELLRRMKGIDQRGAHLVSCIAVAQAEGIRWMASERVEGWIAPEPRGEGLEGLGYDSVFVGKNTDGKTYAEIGPASKNLRSHRRRAMNAMYDWISQYPEWLS